MSAPAHTAPAPPGRDDFEALFAPDRPDEPARAPAGTGAWKVLLVDDDRDVHAALRLVLDDVSVDGRPLHLIDAHSAAEARRLMAAEGDIALVLLDVVMETEHAGLDLVRHLRDELGNALVQIVVLTGQPGFAPRRELVMEYDINGYRLKSELTRDKIFVSVHTALRTHQRMLALQCQREQLERQTQQLQRQQQELARHQELLEQRVAERTAELERSGRHLAETQFAMDRAGIAIGWAELASGRTLYVNDEACRQLGYSREELLQLSLHDINPEIGDGRFAPLRAWLAQSDHAPPFETLHRRKDGSVYPVEVTIYRRASPERDWLIVFFSDITERRRTAVEAEARALALEESNEALEQLNTRLTQMHTQLVHAEKMASIGQLAAGIAHEINNPVGYVKSNLNALGRYVEDFLHLFDAYAQARDRLAGHAPAAAAFAEVQRLAEAMEFDYVREDIRALLAESAGGLERVAGIVRDLKDFARNDAAELWAEDDLHRGLESTLNVIGNQLKYTCEVRREFGALPRVQCVLPQLNQVFMNLLLNAAQAIDGHGTITITTGAAGEQVWVDIADTGKGIPPEHLDRIFLPFFTTKPVGAGTGLGLSISYNLVHKHHGRIEVQSTPGRGSRFRVWLPVRQPAPAAAPAGAGPQGEAS